LSFNAGQVREVAQAEFNDDEQDRKSRLLLAAKGAVFDAPRNVQLTVALDDG
jgi:hypothetical protein